jgi:hypothetical protein
MTNSNKLADALAARDAAIQQAQIWKMEAQSANATIAEIYRLVGSKASNWNGANPVREALAEHDAQPAHAHAQTSDDLVPYYQPTPEEIEASCNGTAPAPAAGDAGDLEPLMIALESAYRHGRANAPFATEDCVRKTRAAIAALRQPSGDDLAEQFRLGYEAGQAALRQPVPYAVRELPGKWRMEGPRIRQRGHSNYAAIYTSFANELESALASQQESRNG